MTYTTQHTFTIAQDPSVNKETKTSTSEFPPPGPCLPEPLSYTLAPLGHSPPYKSPSNVTSSVKPSPTAPPRSFLP